MRHHAFEDWCDSAVSGIIFSPDQVTVYKELYAHLEDHYDFLRAQGVEPGDAEKQVVEAMGDPYVIAPQLAAIHKPFWAYFLRATRWLLIVMLILTCIPIGKFLLELDFSDPSHHDYDIYDASNYGGDTGRTLLMLTQPDISFKDSGYTYTVTDAVVWKHTYEGEEKAFLYLRLKQFNPLPWAVFDNWQNYALYHLYAVDALGTYYYCMEDRLSYEEPYVALSGDQTGPMTHEYVLWINDIQLEGNDWIEFIYDRDGRDHTIRIDLPGGEQE